MNTKAAETMLAAMTERRGEDTLFFPGPWRRAYIMQPEDDVHLHKTLRSMTTWRIITLVVLMLLVFAGIAVYVQINHGNAATPSPIVIGLFFLLVRYSFVPLWLSFSMRGRPRSTERRGLIEGWRAEAAVSPASAKTRLLIYSAMLGFAAYSRWVATPHTTMMEVRTGLYAVIIAVFVAKYVVMSRTVPSVS